ncbi:MAG: alkaline phosphatase family protein [Gemmatimonadetes bacterium]|nr:alkaline phosphatase family protein [Gemmatimonadota bacterium]
MLGVPERILFIFLDGVGLGEDDARTNPLVRAHLPVLRELLGGASLVRGGETRVRSGAPARLVAADAGLGVAGRPQSGTGQTSLLTGTNAPALLGRHFGPWVHTSQRALLTERNLLRRAADAGRHVAFANAYPRRYLESERASTRRPAAPPLAARSAGALIREETALRNGDAVASSLSNDAWREHVDPLAPLITAAEAGRNLARISLGAELTLFAHYDTDVVGHRGNLHAAVEVLERVDAFLGGVAASLDAATLLVIASDHGNIEDVTVGHTLNPTPLLAMGPARDRVADRVGDLTDIAPAILDLLDVRF